MRRCEAGGRLGVGIDGERVHASKLKVGYTGCGGIQLSGGETMCMVCSDALLALPVRIPTPAWLFHPAADAGDAYHLLFLGEL